MLNKRTYARSMRPLLAATMALLLAAAGLATVLTVTAAPAGSAPVTLTVTGDAAARNTSASGVLTWEGGDFSELQSLITAPNFGEATFILGTPVTEVTPAALAGVDVYFASAVSGGYTVSEATALLDWIEAGGVLIANTNSLAFDVTAFLGPNAPPGPLLVEEPPSHWSSGAVFPENDCSTAPGTIDCVNDDSAPVASPAVGPTNPLNEGVASVRTWHTFTYFDEATFPDEAVELFEYSFPCPTAAPSACADTDWNNDVPTARPVAAYVPFNSTQFGAGAIVMTTDADMFSDDALGSGEGNDAFATNVFEWIGTALAGPGSVANAGFTAVTPTRIHDTRLGYCAPVGKLASGATREVQVTGALNCGPASVTIPADAAAVALNVTATNQTGGGFLTTFPTGSARPNTSNLNLPPAVRDIANAVVVAVGTGGKVSIYNSDPGNATDLVVDIVGYWQANTGGLLNAIDPGRVFDTRNAFGTTATKMGPGETRAVQVTGVIPHLGRELVPTGSTGVVLNVTSTNSTTGGFLTVHATPTVPNASNVNFPAGRNVPNLVLADLDSNGRVNVTNALGLTDVLVDVMGYFGTTGDELTPLTPDRAFDNRPGAKIGPDQTVTVTIAGRPQIPAGVTAVLANVTVDASTAAGFLTVYPQAPLPNTSNVNFIAGDTVPNLVLARVNSGGQVLVTHTSPGSSNIIVDTFAAFA
jgi:hypothetical protein